jgi:hypothetical protein
MPKAHRYWLGLAAICILFLTVAVLADSSNSDLECIPEQPYQHSLDGDKNTAGVGVPRDRVLLEIVTRTS